MRYLICLGLLAGIVALASCARAANDDSNSDTESGMDAKSMDKAMNATAEGATSGMSAYMTAPFKDMTGEEHTLSDYLGKVILVVNTASKCGFTPQYAGLEEIYQKYADEGLVIIAFPSNDYGGQEPGTNEQIAEFCQANYGVTFPVMAKVRTKGEEKCPLYVALTGEASPHPGAIKWNFEKFLIGRDGIMIDRYSSLTKPNGDKMKEDIESALAKSPPDVENPES